MKVLLVAEESAGVRTLRMLAGAPHEIVGVCTGAPRTGLRGATVGDVARQLGLPTWPARSVREESFATVVTAAEVDVILNVHSLYRIDPAVLAAARVGGFNLHPGPLPEYAGLNAPSWALYHGAAWHGVTLHWLAADVDRGDVVWRETFPIDDADTGLTVSARCLERGLPLLRRLIDVAAADPGAIPRQRQDAAAWRWFGREVPAGGRVDWSRPARDVVNFVRACDYFPLASPWGTPRARLGGTEVGIAKAALTRAAATEPPGSVRRDGEPGVLVAAGDEWVRVLRFDEVR